MTTKNAMPKGAMRHRLPGSRLSVLDVLRRFGTVIAFVLIVVYFAGSTNGALISSGNIAAILNQAAVVGTMALGLTVCLVLGQLDLSIGYVATLSGLVVTGLQSQQGLPPLVSIPVALAVAALIGLVNGVVVTWLKVNALLATLAMGAIIGGVISWYTITPFTTGIADDFVAFGQTRWGFLPAPAVVLIATAVVLWVFLQQTPTGRRMYALGGNPEAARNAGVRIARLQIVAFVISGLCSGIAGILLSAQLGSGQPTGAVGLLLGAFSAAFLGASTWRDGEFHIGGTILGVLVIGVVFSGLALTDAQYYLKDIVTGAILILAVGSANLLRVRSTR
ncbi:MAG TPA: ABC transporter permease [Pseudolysinimonas sp.]|nr:ABC transporter permease [Pseudolysinimonas sp.]